MGGKLAAGAVCECGGLVFGSPGGTVPKPYRECCEPPHRGAPAATAEALMRSRYCAYVLGLEAYLLATWHETTRPERLDLARSQAGTRWLGLEVRHFETAADGAHAVVAFVARFREGGGRAGRLQESSRFVREEDGRWYYVDGEMHA